MKILINVNFCPPGHNPLCSSCFEIAVSSPGLLLVAFKLNLCPIKMLEIYLSLVTHKWFQKATFIWIMNSNSLRLKLQLSCFWSIFCFFNQNFHEFSQRSIISISRFWISFYDCEAENGRVRNILQDMGTQIRNAFLNTKFIQ